VAASCENGNEIPVIVKGEEFLNYLCDCWLPKRDCALCIS
jgi:hypothetical protein